MKFRGFISIKNTLPGNKSRFYCKSTLQKFRKLFQIYYSLSLGLCIPNCVLIVPRINVIQITMCDLYDEINTQYDI